MRLIVSLPIEELALPIRPELGLLILLVEQVNLLPDDLVNDRLNTIPLDIYYRSLRQLEDARLTNYPQFLKLFNSCLFVVDVVRLRTNLYEVKLS